MKKLTAVTAALLVAVGIMLYAGKPEKPQPEATQIAKQGYKPGESSSQELSQDIFMTLLHPYIEKSVEDYYGPGVLVDPWDVKVLSVERPNGYRTSLFLLQLEATPYVHSHLGVGIDRITFRISTGEITVEKFEHIKDLDSLELYQKSRPSNPGNKP